MIKLIILDFDGTLGDTRSNIVLTMSQALVRRGYPVASEEAIAATIGLRLENCVEQLVPGISKADALECARTYRELFEVNRKLLVPRLFPHVKETLASLKRQGFVLTVASSRSSGSLNEFLEEMGVADCISYVIGANNVTNAKPHPEPVLKTLSELGFTPEETLVVGDMPVDILMGQRAGAFTCAVTYGNASREALASEGPDYIIDDFSELIPMVVRPLPQS